MSSSLSKLYQEELFERVIPFWERYSVDTAHGGFFTLLDRAGGVYGTEKYVWLQGRQVWMFALLYNRVEPRPQWLAMAEGGARFLRRFARASDGTFHFALSREGSPLGKQYSIFSDCFAAMAFAELSRANGDRELERLAIDTFDLVYRRLPRPDRDPSQMDVAPPTGVALPMMRLSLPMILLNMAVEMDGILGSSRSREVVETCTDQLMNVFLDPRTGLFRERLAADGRTVDSPNGRLVDPGHGIEAAWFLMEVGERSGDQALVDRATEIMLTTLEFGWDRLFGGIYYFLDIDDKPVQELEWDQKLWWVHLESLLATIMGFRLTGRSECLDWFHRLHEYSWARFSDPEYGEWWGYLNRRGEVSIHSKGGVWKGCFHVPRALYRCALELEKVGL